MAATVWKQGVRRGIAYVEGREAAERVLEATGRVVATAKRGTAEPLLPGAMAVYSDRRGRPFAYQIAFDMRYWDAVQAAIAV